MPKPLKRIRALQPVSREHHHGLLFTWKIKQGLAFGTGVDRIGSYVQWFWQNHLCKHFEFEELHIFPLLGNTHEYVKTALFHHYLLRQLFTSNGLSEQILRSIQFELSNHIRFEERILFQAIQETVPHSLLTGLEEMHASEPMTEWQDAFWIREKGKSQSRS